MTQPNLLSPVAPPTRDGIDLRRCDVADMLGSLTETPALIIVDAPWSYSQQFGDTPPYPPLTQPDIAHHMRLAVATGAPRCAFWITGPQVGEWNEQDHGWGRVVTTGAWVKSDPDDSGHYGQGYHWAGCSELVYVYTQGSAHTDRSYPLRNAWHSPPGEHSEKPVEWQRQWLRRWTKPGDLVVGMYAGRASDARACLLEGRRYVGAEIDPKRHAAALALLAQVRTT